MEEVETRVRSSLDAGDPRTAVVIALEAYGPELLGFLSASSPSTRWGSTKA